MVIRKRILFTLLSVFPAISCFAQQVDPIAEYLPVSPVTYENILLNRKYINPAFSARDTNSFGAYLIRGNRELGLVNSIRESEIGLSSRFAENSADINVVFNGNDFYKNQAILANYSREFTLNAKSSICAGINLGYSRFKYDKLQFYIPGLLREFSPWSYYPDLDLGIAYNRMDQHIGISWLQLLKSTFTVNNQKFDITVQLMTIDYFSRYRLSESLDLQPELLIYSDFNRISYVVNGKFIYRNKVAAGGIVNEFEKSYGFIFSAVIFKHFELAYLLAIINDKKHDNLGNNSLKIGMYL